MNKPLWIVGGLAVIALLFSVGAFFKLQTVVASNASSQVGAVAATTETPLSLAKKEKTRIDLIATFPNLNPILAGYAKDLQDKNCQLRNLLGEPCPTTLSNVLVFTRLSPSSPVKRTVSTSASLVTPNVILGVFSVKAQGGNGTLNSLSVHFTSTQGGIPVATSTLYSNVRLVDANGNLLAGANSISGGSPTFSNLSVSLTQEVWTDFKIIADVNPNVSGVSSAVTFEGGKYIVGVDNNYNLLNSSGTSNVVSAENIYLSNGVVVTPGVVAKDSCLVNNNITISCGVHMTFTVQNISNSDVFIAKNPFEALSTVTIPAGVSSSTLSSINITAASGDTVSAYKVAANASRTFTYDGVISKSGTIGGNYSLRIVGVNYGVTATRLTDNQVTAGLQALMVNQTF